MSKLDKIRGNIDIIDEKILKLLSERSKFVIEVKRTQTGKSRYRFDRESSIVRRLCEKNKGPLPNQAVREIYTQIITSFRDSLQLDRPISIAYLGPEGTYSQEAAVKLLGESTELHSENTIADVVGAVESDSADLAVVPVENSSEGAVRETHKLLLDTTVNICAEISLPIIHNLMSKSSLGEIEVVYGHPHGLAQCSVWVKTHLPNAKLIPAESNAKAAEISSNDNKSAAIASKKAADIYGLNILKRGVNDQPGNKTRFVALGRSKTKPSGNDKTSLFCVLNDKPGALHEILGFFADKNISLTRLESQPYRQGQYAFHIDFIGHQQTDFVSDVLENINKNTKVCRILGSYPVEIENDKQV